MSGGEKVDPISTYVLDETAITKAKTIEELAELAMRQTEERDAEAASDSHGLNESEDAAPQANRPNRRNR